MNSGLTSFFNLFGMVLDAFGGLLLAYDLLGGEHGTLRLLIRMGCYTIIGGVLMGLILGAKFAIIGGLTFGISLGLELHRKAKGQTEHNYKFELFIGLLRSFGLGLAIAYSHALSMGLVFGVLSFVLVAILQYFKLVPPIPYAREITPSISLSRFVPPLKRVCVITLLVVASALIAGPGTSQVNFGLQVGLTFGVSFATMVVFAPTLEWLIDTMPDRALGTAGAIMFVIGFILQSVPDLANLLLHPRQ